MQDIHRILERLKEVKVAVYGDFCLDAYWIMDPRGSEISVETGQQAQSVSKHYYSPGGAGNVVANLAALEPREIRAIGVIGDDTYGRELRKQLKDRGIDTQALVVQQDDFATYSFVKKQLEGQEISRHDFGVNNRRSSASDQIILKNIREALEQCDVLIFNQQVPGSSPNLEFVESVNKLFAAFPNRLILVDSRHFNRHFRNVSLKINELELARINGRQVRHDDYISTTDIRSYGQQVFQWMGRPLFVTCGSRGIMAFDDRGVHHAPGLQLIGELDTTGAGDTALSAIALCMGAGVTPGQAVQVGNFAAGVTVQKLQTTGTAGPEEIAAIARDPDYIYRPELAANPQQAVYFTGTEIERCYDDLPDFGQIKHVVFDHDGTISTLREGWERIMEPVMLHSILGDQEAGVNPALYQKIRRRVIDYIDQSTGIQTIIQMEALVQMVREFGLVPEDQILDKWGYKEAYNDALLEMVSRRKQKFQSGQLHLEDFTIKGAVSALQALKDRGIMLYLASGTDHDDVVDEAETLGYAALFEGRIYGSVGDVQRYSKQMVLQRIIRENKLQGPELAVIGDGPVEIRECRKVGGIAVGIACEEPRRYGLNPEKRTRLIRAGAHLIIPDFAQYRQLLALLLGD